MYFAGQGDSSIECNAIAIRRQLEATAREETAEVDVTTARNRELGSGYPSAAACLWPMV